MRKTLIIDLFLGFAAAFFESQENDSAVRYVKKVLALKQAGENVDEHMRSVADSLINDEPLDFDELIDRIDAEADEFLAIDVPDEPPPEPPTTPDPGGDNGGSGDFDPTDPDPGGGNPLP